MCVSACVYKVCVCVRLRGASPCLSGSLCGASLWFVRVRISLCCVYMKVLVSLYAGI